MGVTHGLLTALGLAVAHGVGSAPVNVLPRATPSLPAQYHCRIEIHDRARGWQPGWQKADYKTQLFSEARTAIDPATGTNRTDESINDAANKKVSLLCLCLSVSVSVSLYLSPPPPLRARARELV